MRKYLRTVRSLTTRASKHVTARVPKECKRTCTAASKPRLSWNWTKSLTAWPKLRRTQTRVGWKWGRYRGGDIEEAAKLKILWKEFWVSKPVEIQRSSKYSYFWKKKKFSKNGLFFSLLGGKRRGRDKKVDGGRRQSPPRNWLSDGDVFAKGILLLQ